MSDMTIDIANSLKLPDGVDKTGSLLTKKFSGVLLRRKIKNFAAWALFGLFFVLIIAPLLWLLYRVFKDALSNWSFSVLFTPTAGNGGGISNAIVGTLYIILGVGLLAGIFGIGIGIYLSEYANSFFRKLVGTCADVLSGVPSILFGFVGYELLVLKFGWGMSSAAAIIVLSVMVLPYVAKSTETALSKIPTSYREGARALGMNKSQIVFKVVIRQSIPMILNGLIIAIAIAIGETAPMLYTAGWVDGYPKYIQFTHAPLPYLTYLVWTDYNQPFKSAKILSNDAALAILVIVGLLFFAAKLIVRFMKSYN